MTPYHELRAQYTMNISGLRLTWMTLGRELKAVENMSSSELWAQRYRCYKQLSVVDDMNDSRSKDLRVLNGMNSLGLWLTWMAPSRWLSALDAMNRLGLWMTWMMSGCELKALDAMKSLGLWMTWITLGHVLKALDAMDNIGLWCTQMTLINNSKSWD